MNGYQEDATSWIHLLSTSTCARCPEVTPALDAVREAYHNSAAVWWGLGGSLVGACAASAVIRDGEHRCRMAAVLPAGD